MYWFSATKLGWFIQQSQGEKVSLSIFFVLAIKTRTLFSWSYPFFFLNRKVLRHYLARLHRKTLLGCVFQSCTLAQKVDCELLNLSCHKKKKGALHFVSDRTILWAVRRSAHFQLHFDFTTLVSDVLLKIHCGTHVRGGMNGGFGESDCYVPGNHVSPWVVSRDQPWPKDRRLFR